MTRLSESGIPVITAGASQMRDLAWLKRHTAEEDGVQIADVTSAYAVLSIMGPNSRKLLSKLTDEDLSNDHFPFGTGKEIEIGYSKALALRVTYVGELGGSFTSHPNLPRISMIVCLKQERKWA